MSSASSMAASSNAKAAPPQPSTVGEQDLLSQGCSLCGKPGFQHFRGLYDHLRHNHGVTLKSIEATPLGAAIRAEKARISRDFRSRQKHEKDEKKANATAEQQVHIKSEAEEDESGAVPPQGPMSPPGVPAVPPQGPVHPPGVPAVATPSRHQPGIVMRDEVETVHIEPDNCTWQAFWVKMPPDNTIPAEFIMTAARTGDTRDLLSPNRLLCTAITAEAPAPPAHEEHPAPPAHEGHPAPAAAPAFDASCRQKWVDLLPAVELRDLYSTVELPEQSSPGHRTSGWPVTNLPDHTLTDFYEWVTTEKTICKQSLARLKLDIKRFLHFFVDADGNDTTGERASNPLWLVAIYMKNLHKKMFGWKILGPEYTWTLKFLGAIKLFALWQKERIGKLTLACDENERAFWDKAAAAIDQLSTSLGGGLTKQACSRKLERRAQRRQRDAEVIQNFPPVEDMKTAVRRAMAVLHQVYTEHGTADKLPIAAQAVATTAMVGIIFYNGFAGRKAEWEIMDKAYVQQQLDANKDYLVCKSHKTAKTYGSIAKWVAPGTVAACKV